MSLAERRIRQKDITRTLRERATAMEEAYGVLSKKERLVLRRILKKLEKGEEDESQGIATIRPRRACMPRHGIIYLSASRSLHGIVLSRFCPT